MEVALPVNSDFSPKYIKFHLNLLAFFVYLCYTKNIHCKNIRILLQ